MSAIIANLSELIKMLFDSFRLPALFPSLIFVTLNWVFVIPNLEFIPLVRKLVDLDTKDQTFIVGVLVLLFTYTLNAVEVPIIRFYEGYPWKDSWWGKFLLGWQRGRVSWMRSRKRQLESSWAEETDSLRQRAYFTKIQEIESVLRDYYPPEPTRMLPTKLGNVIAAFEAYPGKKYCMDSITYWPRMYPILTQHQFITYVTGPRYIMDFLLNNSLLMGVFSVECLLLRIFCFPNISWLLPAVALGAAIVFYKSAISSAQDWGAMFCASFDLFRYHLADALGLKPARQLEKERELWENLARFFASKQNSFQGFGYNRDEWPVSVKSGGK